MHGIRPHWHINTWNTVAPSTWFPTTSLEQSMMELDDFVSTLAPTIRRPLAMELTAMPTRDDDFFADLPGFEEQEMETEEAAEEEEEEPALSHAYSTYSYSSSSSVGKDGKMVESTRRRYQDAAGRVKATQVRRIGDKVCTEIWNKPDESAKGTYVNKGVKKEKFEKLWNDTEFGKATQKVLKEEEKKMVEEEKKP